jgi:N-formylglutamate amidohydrolase
MTKPLVICAPHAKTTVEPDIAKRLLLDEYQIWQFGDPFIDETCQHPQAHAILIGESNRLVQDPARPHMTHDMYHTHTFYGQKIYKDSCEFTEAERAQYREKYAASYIRRLDKAVQELVDRGEKKILVIDHHNTAGDHRVGQTGQYMPVITFCSSLDESVGVSAAPEEMVKNMQRAFTDKTGLSAEINHVYSSSNISRYVRDTLAGRHEDVQINCVFIEYNLSLIHNPLTRKSDTEAILKMRDAINASIDAVI